MGEVKTDLMAILVHFFSRKKVLNIVNPKMNSSK
jgi:hypothetical protein